MINITDQEFNDDDYDKTDLRLAERQDDGTYDIYYATDEKGAANYLAIEKTVKNRDLGINIRNAKKTKLINIDVPLMGLSVYLNDKKSFDRIHAKRNLKTGFKVYCDGVRVLHTTEQIEFIYEAMIERYETLVEQQEETQEAINEAATIEELELIDINIEV